MCGTKANQHVDMIGDTANFLGDGPECADCATYPCVQTLAPFRGDHWRVIFGSENDVIMKAEMRAAHPILIVFPGNPACR